MTNQNGSSRKSALTSVTVKHSASVAGGKIYKTVQKMDLDRTTAARGPCRVSHPRSVTTPSRLDVIGKLGFPVKLCCGVGII